MKLNRTWHTARNRTVYAVVYKHVAGIYFSDFVGAYEKVAGGFKCQHRLKKIWQLEVEARRDVILHGIKRAKSEIDEFEAELNRISQNPQTGERER
jgi:hypothetical protein